MVKVLTFKDLGHSTCETGPIETREFSTKVFALIGIISFFQRQKSFSPMLLIHWIYCTIESFSYNNNILVWSSYANSTMIIYLFDQQ